MLSCKKCTRRCHCKLKSVLHILAFCTQRTGGVRFLLRIADLAFRKQRVDQYCARAKFVIRLLFLMKLALVTAHRRDCVPGMALLDRKLGESNLAFGRYPFFTSLCSER